MNWKAKDVEVKEAMGRESFVANLILDGSQCSSERARSWTNHEWHLKNETQEGEYLVKLVQFELEDPTKK